MQAVNLYDSIKLKSLRSLLGGKVTHSSPHELQLQYGDHKYLFVYRFGCLVFFNMTTEESDREIAKLKAALGDGVTQPTSEVYQIHLSDGPHKVEFEHVEIKKLTADSLRLIAMTLGQSAGLEYFELSADRMLYETSSFMQDMARGGRIPVRTKRLLQIIGNTAGTRQNIISNLNILDPPEEAWQSKELGKMHTELQQNFDIDLRFRTLDRKLTLIQDNIEILADLVARRNTALLEGLVVILIIVEIAFAIILKTH